MARDERKESALIAQAVVIADDVTGGMEGAIALHLSGITTEVHLKPPGQKDMRTPGLVLLSGTRAVSSEDAAHQLDALVARVANAWRLQIKTDSLGRGHLVEEVAAARRFAAGGLTIVCPANPMFGRVVRHGLLSLYAADGSARPIADLRRLLNDGGCRPETIDLVSIRDDSLPKLLKQLRPGAVVLADAVTMEDLHALVAAAVTLPRPPAWVGSGALSLALGNITDTEHASTPRRLRFEGPAVAVVGSRDPQAPRQVMVARQGGAQIIEIDPNTARDWWDIGEAPVVVVPTAPVDTDLQELVVKAIVRRCRRILDRARTVIAIGGDTAAAVFSELGETITQPVANWEPGCVVSTGRSRPGVRYLTRAGSFGDDESLVRIFGELTQK